MRGSIQQRSAAAWRLAAKQHWVVTRAQLFALGYDARAIERRLANGRLRTVWRGVYEVGRRGLSRDGRLMAAVLACGPDAVLSHPSAAELWGMLPERGGPIHVSLLAAYQRRLPGITIHRRVALGPSDVTKCRGIPVTAPICTLIDIGVELGRGAVETAINEGSKRDLFDPDELEAALSDGARRPGVGKLRAIIGRHTFTLTDSELERRFLPIADAAGLPPPETQRYVNGFRVDFYWDFGLVVETDGLRYHRTPAQQAKDLVRDQVHTAAGLTTLRFTHAQVRFEPAYVRETLATIAARLLN